MTELLSTSEYRRIARELNLPGRVVIDGEARTARSGDTFATINPATDEHLADVPARATAIPASCLAYITRWM